MLPLSAPALAVVAIFSILSRWNDFLLPLVVLNRREVFTLQLALASFQVENQIHYDQLLAMTTLTALPLAFDRWEVAGVDPAQPVYIFRQTPGNFRANHGFMRAKTKPQALRSGQRQPEMPQLLFFRGGGHHVQELA